MEDHFVFILRFEERAAVDRAYGIVSGVQSVEGCTVEPDELRIRFLAEKRTGVPLVERVYEHGGLVWSTRYAAKR